MRIDYYKLKTIPYWNYIPSIITDLGGLPSIMLFKVMILTVHVPEKVLSNETWKHIKEKTRVIDFEYNAIEGI